MKKAFILFLAFFVCLSCQAHSQEQPVDKVVVYYFRGNFRCVSCKNIEAYTREALEKYFSDEIAAGRVGYRVVNVDEKCNEHYTQDYNLYTKSVVLSKMQNGAEVEYKNLEKVWQYLNNKDIFYEYINAETKKFLEKEEDAAK